ncbi:MAG: response regulator [Myxococcaceae bacterium]|nr:MAG: response regulator [Myxococcaceae bacterium]
MSNEDAAVVSPRARVFLVDDNPAAVEPIHQRLCALGHVTTVLHDGAQVLEAARRERPDLAILEVLLPEVNGYQLCRELKRLERPPIVVMLTARSEPEDRFWATECGADLFLSKPVEPELLVQQVTALLAAK